MDLFLFQQLNQYAGKWPGLDFLGVFLAKYFEYFLILLLFVFLLEKFSRAWKMILKALIAAVLARLAIVNIIRWIWPRARPFAENNVTLLVAKSSEASFPSGHAAFYFAISTVVFSYNKEVGVLFYLLSFLICVARIFVGLHWPSDILAGAAVGIFSGWLINKIAKGLSGKI